MTDFPTRLESCMASRNFHIRGKINYSITGKWQRFPDATKGHKRSRDLFVVLHDHDRGATFGDWHYPDDWYTFWTDSTGKKPTVTELKRRHEDAEKLKVRKALDKAQCELRARALFRMLYVKQWAGDHPYVKAKRIFPYHAKQVRSWLLVPIHDVHHRLVTLQIIKPDGFKRLWKGTSQKGCMIWLSEPLQYNYEGTILVCEGYSTGCTLRRVSDWPVVCALNANNIFHTVQLLRQKFLHACIKICADNDQWNERENTGLVNSNFTTRQFGITQTWPEFDGLDVSQKPTDFNDLYALTHSEEVKRQIIINRVKKVGSI